MPWPAAGPSARATITNENNTDKRAISTEATLKSLSDDKVYHNENVENIEKKSRKRNYLRIGSQNNDYRVPISSDMKYKTNKTKVNNSNADENNENQKREKSQKKSKYTKSINNNGMNIDFNEKIG